MPNNKSAKPKFITLRSQSPSARILLRTPIRTDAYSLVCRVQDPECTTYLPHLRFPKNPITIQSNEKQIELWRNASGITEQFLVVVLLPERPAEDGLDPVATVGDTGLAPLNIAAGTAECGIMLNSGPDMRGKGIAVEALAMQFAYGFEHLGLEIISFHTSKDNVPRRGLLEKKFGLEARCREEEGDWELVATKSWWNERQHAAGPDRQMVVSVDEGL
ncbi:unnamed protein product [Cyclocybe aegerita]|uniref:N-acetyltransferase domain-containing protein n=1 Tax=Cyclocybe aegerita TaxID=1973307 RepID=A0A8S0WS72_CYCAE|nr:unnamed protein product [Cyclocybe aegerita]